MLDAKRVGSSRRGLTIKGRSSALALVISVNVLPIAKCECTHIDAGSSDEPPLSGDSVFDPFAPPPPPPCCSGLASVVLPPAIAVRRRKSEAFGGFRKLSDIVR